MKNIILSAILAATFIVASPALAQTTHSVRFIAGGASFGGGTGPVPYDGMGAAAALTGGIGAMTLGSDDQIYFPGLRFHTIRRMNSVGLVSTIAGIRGQDGAVDGPALSATFTYPIAMINDNAGGFYVVSRSDGPTLIRRISASGVVSTIPFITPAGKDPNLSFGHIAMAPGGKIYVAYSNSIFVLDPTTGVLTHFVGDINDTSGFVNATGASARFYGIGQMISDNLGNIYLGENGNKRIRKISAMGVVSTIAGSGIAGRLDGPANVARFNGIQAIARDTLGNLYVGDVRTGTGALNTGCWIRKVSPTGVVSSLAGANTCGYANGNALGGARFGSVTTMLFAHNRLYVFDSETTRLRYICRKTGPSTGSPFAPCPL